MLRSEKRIVKTASGREALLEKSGYDESGLSFQLNFEDLTTSIRAPQYLTDMPPVQNFETMKSLERTAIDFGEGENVWTSPFTLAMDSRGFKSEGQDVIIAELEDAYERVGQVLLSVIDNDDVAARTKTLEVGIAEQFANAKLSDVRRLIQSNTWSSQHHYLIPLLLAEIHGIELWIHYAELEETNTPNVIRFTCSGKQAKTLCVLSCKKNRIYATRKTCKEGKHRSEPTPGDVYKTPQHSNREVRLIRRITVEKNGIKSRRYVVEASENGMPPKEYLMRESAFKKMIKKSVFDASTPRQNNVISPGSFGGSFGDMYQPGGMRKSRASSWLTKHPRISVISRLSCDTLNEYTLDFDKVEIWDSVVSVQIKSTHGQIPEEINGAYQKQEEDYNDYFLWKNEHGFMIYNPESPSFRDYLVVSKEGEAPLIRIHRDKLDVEIFYCKLQDWYPNVNNFVELDYQYMDELPGHYASAFNHLGVIQRERSGLRSGIMGLSSIVEEESRSASVLTSEGDDLPTMGPLTRGVTETRRAHKFAFSKRTYLNQYCLGKELGTGSFGKVVFGIDTNINRKVAIKILQKQKKKRSIGGKRKKKKIGGRGPTRKNTKEQQKYDREIAIMKKINHPNLVRLYELIDDENLDDLFLVLEYIDGGTLADVSKPIKDISQLRGLFCDIMKGLEYLHNRRIGHSDLKPANVLISKTGVAKVCDFGVSTALGSINSYVTFIETTPSYKSPELVRYLGEIEDAGDVDLKPSFKPWPADIWAAGVMLLEMATGHNPFHIPRNIDETEKRIRTYDPFEDPDCPCWHSDAVTRMPRVVDPNYISNNYINENGLKDPVQKAGRRELNLLIKDMLIKDPRARVKLKAIVHHAWVSDYHNRPWNNDLSLQHLHAPDSAVCNQATLRFDEHDLDAPEDDPLAISPSLKFVEELKRKFGAESDSATEKEEEVEARDVKEYILYNNISPKSTTASFEDFDNELESVEGSGSLGGAECPVYSPRVLHSGSTGAAKVIIE